MKFIRQGMLHVLYKQNKRIFYPSKHHMKEHHLPALWTTSINCKFTRQSALVGRMLHVLYRKNLEYIFIYPQNTTLKSTMFLLHESATHVNTIHDAPVTKDSFNAFSRRISKVTSRLNHRTNIPHFKMTPHQQSHLLHMPFIFLEITHFLK